jgi:cytoskeletal protein CcmA (bactofilin family)
MRRQKGLALPLAMLALCIGSLVVTPFLTYAGTSLISSATYEQSLAELYSCEAGIEFGIWNLQSGNLVVSENATADLPPFMLNNKTVEVTVENTGSQTYVITSTADGGSSSTTIHSYVSLGGGTWTSDGAIDSNTTGEVYVEGNVDIDIGVSVDGSVYATGDVLLGNGAEVTGDIITEGNLDLSNNAYIGGNVTTNGTLTLGNNTEIGSFEVGGNVYATGGIILYNNAIIYGDVYTNGDVMLGTNCVIKGDVYIGPDAFSLILDNNAVIEGNIYIYGDMDNIQLANNASIYLNVYATGDIITITREINVVGDVYQNYSGEYPPPPEAQPIPEGGGTSIIPG